MCVCTCFKKGIGSLVITSIRIRLLLLSLIYAKWSAPAAYVYVLFAKQNENNNLALGFAEEQTAAQAQKYHRVGEKGVNRKRKYAPTLTLAETWGHSHTHTLTQLVYKEAKLICLCAHVLCKFMPKSSMQYIFLLMPPESSLATSELL